MEKTTQAQVLRYWKDGYFYFSIYPISQSTLNGTSRLILKQTKQRG